METTLPTLVDLFATTKQAEGRSPKTVSWYREMLSQFVAFTGEDLPLKDLDVDLARKYVAELQSRDVRWENCEHRPEAEGGDYTKVLLGPIPFK